MRVLCIRVSTEGQNIARQEKKGFDKVYIDRVSGDMPFLERPASERLKKDIEKGGITEVHFHDVDRLGRDLLDVLQTIKWLRGKGIVVCIDTVGRSDVNGKSNFIFDMVVSLMGTFAQMQLITGRKNQKDGIALAKAKGVYKGRAEGTTISRAQILEKYKKEVATIKKHPSLSLVNLAKLTSRSERLVKKLKKFIRYDEAGAT